MQYDVMCVGEMVIDFTPGQEKNSYIRNAGGAPANVAIALSRFGCRAAFCGKLGNDDFGRYLLDLLKENGVNVLLDKLTDKAVTTMAFVSLKESGERSFTFARKPGADMLLKPEDISESFIENAAIIHAGSCSLSKSTAREATRFAIRRGIQHHKLISFDLNYRSLLWDDNADARKQIEAVLPDIDLLKISEEEVYLVGGDNRIPEMMKTNDIAVCVLTRGSDGASLYYSAERYDIPPVQATAVDTNGAGDAFWGGFLATLIEKEVKSVGDLDIGVLLKAMQFGTAAGSIAVRQYGAIPSLPRKQQVLNELMKRSG